MATYEIYFEGDSHYVECDSMSEAIEEAADLVADPDMDWKVEEGGSITYYDYFVNVVVKKYDDDEDETRMTLVHETELPDECPFCEADDWDDSESVYMHGSTYWHTSTCRECGAKKKEISYGKYQKLVNGIWVERSVIFTEGDGKEEEEEEKEEEGDEE